MTDLPNTWQKVLQQETKKDYYKNIWQFLEQEYNSQTIYPKKQDVFNALQLTPYDTVKVVILGQDPYHGEGQAHGLSFSVQKGVKVPPSLVNIYKEIEAEFNVPMPKNYGNLTSWAEQGVLLLNTTLTVQAGQANSHKSIGWQKFTDAVIKAVNDKETPCVFILWGANAIKKQKLIDGEKHLVLTGVHPSPLSSYRGFFGCDHFKLANYFLAENNLSPINWQIKSE